MSGGNGSHVGGAMAEDMGKGFVGCAMAAGAISTGPAVFYDIREYAVETGSMDETPVFKTNIESRVMPRRSVGESITCKSSWGLDLVAEISQSGGCSLTGEVVQEATGVFCKHGFVIVRGSDGRRAFVRDRDDDWERFGSSSGLCPQGSSSRSDLFKASVRGVGKKARDEGRGGST